ncbi:transglycosylase SLT domain-containing protein [Methylococcus sp. EFPC2]|uniref:transglycosylase SLT domain-containing protein n=1 Tax=Methylococcus sp. EFPC2 TaxID=2812648 RepID=UPI0019681C91|nr:transglycosylase SLT domain-containing protein [Methylococcus sp. EFPC2]QSA95486.1 transglycosylase SLT domain-containing protein [Methylococcus sp. EFPC2]
MSKAPLTPDGQAPKPRPRRATARKAPKRKAAAQNPTADVSARRKLALLAAEGLALCIAALVTILSTLGRAAEHFGGTGFWSSLLPFALAVLGLGLIHALFLWLWLHARGWLSTRAIFWPASAALAIALVAGGYGCRNEFAHELGALRTLVGGVQEAERNTVAHQVYAAYRRTDLAQMQKMMARAEPFLPAIHEAAGIYRVDEEVLVGVAAAESSFLPRDSRDGGRGLFQITAPPKSAAAQARQRLGVAELNLADARHNAHVAAATLNLYLQEMRGDLFLGLLAYNIGPQNGGLLSIMKQYGARDFATIQPYLQNLPRDYPIRVLSAALAYRLWHGEGKLPRYEEGDNALHIQRLGIPGMAAG